MELGLFFMKKVTFLITIFDYILQKIPKYDILKYDYYNLK